MRALVMSGVKSWFLVSWIRRVPSSRKFCGTSVGLSRATTNRRASASSTVVTRS